MRRTTARVSTRGRIVLPPLVRERLDLAVGDTVRFRVEGSRRIVLGREDRTEPFAAFEEWASPEDAELYREL